MTEQRKAAVPRQSTARVAAAARGSTNLDVVVVGVLVVAAVVSVAAGIPAAVRTAAVGAAALSLGWMLWRRSRCDGWELLASGAGGALAVAVVGGVLLDRSPTGIDRIGWAGMMGLCGLGLLAAAARRPVVRRAALPRPSSVLFSVGTGVVVAVAVTAAVLGSRATDAQPVQMWLSDPDSSQSASVALRSPGPGGPYDLWLEPEGGEPVLLTSGLTLPADEVVSVRLPSLETRTAVVLRAPGVTEPARSVTIEPED